MTDITGGQAKMGTPTLGEIPKEDSPLIEPVYFGRGDVPLPMASWDIEIDSDSLFDSDRPVDYSQIGVTCASILATDGGDAELYWGGMYEAGEVYNPKMNKFEMGEMIESLLHYDTQGYHTLTWNGAQFDFRVMAELMPDYKDALRGVMYNSVDLMFQFFCQRGFFVGLDAVSRAMGLAGKHQGPQIDGQYIDGGLAAKHWPEHARKILWYVHNDTVQPLLLAQKIHGSQELRWVTKKGKIASEPFREILTVEQSLELPLPDTSWMDNPITREKALSFWA